MAYGTGWVLLPVGTQHIPEGEVPKASDFEFENKRAWFEDHGGAWGFVSTEQAGTISEAAEWFQNTAHVLSGGDDDDGEV